LTTKYRSTPHNQDLQQISRFFPFDAMGMGTPSRVILNRPGVWMNTAGEERTIHPVSAFGELGSDSLGDIASGAVFTRVPD
jgi:hypothetical protein